MYESIPDPLPPVILLYGDPNAVKELDSTSIEQCQWQSPVHRPHPLPQ